MTPEEFMAKREDFEKRLSEFLAKEDDLDGLLIGWALVRVSQDVEGMGTGRCQYAFNMPFNQPVHVTRGLLAMATDEFNNPLDRCGPDCDHD